MSTFIILFEVALHSRLFVVVITHIKQIFETFHYKYSLDLNVFTFVIVSRSFALHVKCFIFTVFQRCYYFFFLSFHENVFVRPEDICAQVGRGWFEIHFVFGNFCLIFIFCCIRCTYFKKMITKYRHRSCAVLQQVVSFVTYRN